METEKDWMQECVQIGRFYLNAVAYNDAAAWHVRFFVNSETSIRIGKWCEYVSFRFVVGGDWYYEVPKAALPAFIDFLTRRQEELPKIRMKRRKMERQDPCEILKLP